MKCKNTAGASSNKQFPGDLFKEPSEQNKMKIQRKKRQEKDSKETKKRHKKRHKNRHKKDTHVKKTQKKSDIDTKRHIEQGTEERYRLKENM